MPPDDERGGFPGVEAAVAAAELGEEHHRVEHERHREHEREVGERAEVADGESVREHQTGRAPDERGNQQLGQEQRRLPEIAPLGLAEEIGAVAGGRGGERRDRHGEGRKP